jgi:hypothetical protein
MSEFNNNPYGLSVFGPHNQRSAVWTSKPVQPAQAVQSLTVSFVGDCQRKRYADLTDLRFQTVTGFADNTATGAFELVFETTGRDLRAYSATITGLTVTVKREILSMIDAQTSQYLIMSNTTSALDTWTVDGTACYESDYHDNYEITRITISGTASVQTPFVFGGIDLQTTDVEPLFQSCPDGGSWTEMGPMDLSSDTILASTPTGATHRLVYTSVFDDPAVRYRFSLILQSSDEDCAPVIRNLDLNATYATPQPAYEGTWSRLIRFRHEDLKTIDRVQIASETPDGWVTETSDALRLVLRTTIADPRPGGIRKAWSLNSHVAAAFDAGLRPTQAGTDGWIRVVACLTDPVTGTAPIARTGFEAILGLDVMFRANDWTYDYVQTPNGQTARSWQRLAPEQRPVCFIDVLKASHDYTDLAPVTSLDQPEANLYGRFMLDDGFWREYVNHPFTDDGTFVDTAIQPYSREFYRHPSFLRSKFDKTNNSQYACLSDVDGPFYLKITLAYHPGYSCRPMLSNISLIGNKHYHQTLSLGDSLSPYSPQVSTILNSRYRQVDGRWSVNDEIYTDPSYGAFLKPNEQVLRLSQLVVPSPLPADYSALPYVAGLQTVIGEILPELPRSLYFYLKYYDAVGTADAGIRVTARLKSDSPSAEFVRLRWQNRHNWDYADPTDQSNYLNSQDPYTTGRICTWVPTDSFEINLADPEAALTLVSPLPEALALPFLVAEVQPSLLANPLTTEYRTGRLAAISTDPQYLSTNRNFAALGYNVLHYYMDGIGTDWNDNVAVLANTVTSPQVNPYTARVSALTGCEIYLAAPKTGAIVPWSAEPRILTGRLNSAGNHRGLTVLLDPDTLPEIGPGLLSSTDPAETDTPVYTVQLVPGSVRSGDQVLLDDTVSLAVTVPGTDLAPFAIVQDTIRCQRSASLTTDYYLRAIDSALNSGGNADRFSVADTAGGTAYVRDTDYLVTFAADGTGSIAWQTGQDAPAAGSLYFISFACHRLQRLQAQFDSTYRIPDSIVEYFRTAPVRGMGVCGQGQDYLSGLYTVAQFDLPAGPVDQNSLRLYVTDANPYVETTVEAGRVRGALAMEDIHACWNPTVQAGYYAINQDQGYQYTNLQTRVFSADTLPILSYKHFMDDALVMEPATLNYLQNSWFARDTALYNLLNSVYSLTARDGVPVYAGYSLPRGGQAQASATVTGNGTLTAYHTPLGHLSFVLDGSIARIETWYNGQLVSPRLQAPVTALASNSLSLAVDDGYVVARLNGAIVFDFDQALFKEGCFGASGTLTAFEIQIPGVLGWTIQSYGDNPVYPLGEQLVFDNRGYTGSLPSYAEQQTTFPPATGHLSFRGGLTAELDASGLGLLSPVVVTAASPLVRFENPGTARLVLSQPQLEAGLPTTYTRISRPDTALTVPQALPIRLTISPLAITGGLLTCGNLRLVHDSGVYLTVGEETVGTETSITFSEIAIEQVSNGLRLSLDGVALGTVTTPYAPADLITFSAGTGRYGLYAATVGLTGYNLINSAVETDTDQIGIPPFKPGTPLVVRDNDIVYRRTFYLKDGQYVLDSTYDFVYLQNPVIDLGLKAGDLLSAYAYTDDGRELLRYQWRGDRIEWIDLTDDYIGETIHVRFVPRRTYCLNATDAGYRLTFSDVSGQAISVSYEDSGEAATLLTQIELNPFRASLNNGFIYLANTLPTAHTIEYRLTPETITREAILVLDCKAENGAFTDNVDLRLNGQPLTGLITTRYGQLELLTAATRPDQASSGRYHLRYTLISQPENGILEDEINVIDCLSGLGIKILTHISNINFLTSEFDTYTRYADLEPFTHEKLAGYTHDMIWSTEIV